MNKVSLLCSVPLDNGYCECLMPINDANFCAVKTNKLVMLVVEIMLSPCLWMWLRIAVGVLMKGVRLN